jgi:dTDP-4-amino-4,6-dideoxygalactose transaminase
VPCPVAEELWERGLYLPSSTALDDETVDRIVSVIRAAVPVA